MRIADILTLDRIACEGQVGSKKRALELLSELISTGDGSLGAAEVLDCLRARERLGSTGLGAGVAIPHGRFPKLQRTVGAFLRLREGVEFDAQDGQPVDLLFGLLVPEESTDEHLQLLSLLAERFGDGRVREGIRAAQVTAPQVLALLSNSTTAETDER